MVRGWVGDIELSAKQASQALTDEYRRVCWLLCVCSLVDLGGLFLVSTKKEDREMDNLPAMAVVVGAIVVMGALPSLIDRLVYGKVRCGARPLVVCVPRGLLTKHTHASHV